MIGNSGNSLNTNINGAFTRNKTKISLNKYYNIFSKKLEEIELPNINLEFNSVMNPEKNSFMRTT